MNNRFAAIERAENYKKQLLEGRQKNKEFYLNKEEKTEDEIQPKANILKTNASWADLMNDAKKINPPTFNHVSGNTTTTILNNNTLGHPILDMALEKAIYKLCNEVNDTSQEISDFLYYSLKNNYTAKKTAFSSVRFLRDISIDDYLDENPIIQEIAKKSKKQKETSTSLSNENIMQLRYAELLSSMHQEE